MKEFIVPIQAAVFREARVNVYAYRLDLMHPEVGGNKYFKLKYNLEQARILGKTTLLTFGGAYSNHIWATASAGKMAGFKTIGIIRGEENLPLNEVLTHAKHCGMELEYLDRTSYRKLKDATETDFWEGKYGGDIYLIPEGGSNAFAVRGCMEIMQDFPLAWQYVCTPCGTGGTLAGLYEAMDGTDEQQVIGFASLKGGEFLRDDVKKLLLAHQPKQKKVDLQLPKFNLMTAYHFGGYAKSNNLLKQFIQDFYLQNNILLDEIYTSKMLFGIYDLASRGYFSHQSTVIALLTQRIRFGG